MVVPEWERDVTLASVVKKDLSKEMGFYQKPEQKEPRRENFSGHCLSPNLGWTWVFEKQKHDWYSSSAPSCKERVSEEEEEGFPGGAVVKNLPANAGDTGSSPELGRSHMLQSN